MLLLGSIIKTLTIKLLLYTIVARIHVSVCTSVFNVVWNCNLSFSGISSKIRIEVYVYRLLIHVQL